MNSNLEHISFEQVISSNNVTYASFRKSLTPNYLVVARDIAKGYLLIILMLLTLWAIDFFSLSIYTKYIIYLFCALLLGASFAFLHLFIHEGAHYNLHPNKKKNDRYCDILLGMLFGISIKSYRKVHWQHHLFLGKPQDTEFTYFNKLTPFFILSVITSIYTFTVIMKRRKIKQAPYKKSLNFPISMLLFVLLQVLISVLLFFTASCLAVAVWFIALGIVFPVFATLRQILEHRDENALHDSLYYTNERPKLSRLFGYGGVIDSFIGAAGFDKHLLHHWDPTISYTRLRDVESFLLDCANTKEIIKKSKTSYIKTFITLFQLS